MTSKNDKMEIDQEDSELEVVLPGDPINITRKDYLKLGPGLTLTQDSVICIKAGILKQFSKKNTWYVENNQRRVNKRSIYIYIYLFLSYFNILIYFFLFLFIFRSDKIYIYIYI
jgi:hypothetical protein